jgi:hypothetical protein
MRVHPVTLALQYLRGRKRIRAAPYYGRSPFRNDQAAVAMLKRFTGQDFGSDTRKWSNWLRKNRREFYDRWVRRRPRGEAPS